MPSQTWLAKPGSFKARNTSMLMKQAQYGHKLIHMDVSLFGGTRKVCDSIPWHDQAICGSLLEAPLLLE